MFKIKTKLFEVYNVKEITKQLSLKRSFQNFTSYESLYNFFEVKFLVYNNYLYMQFGFIISFLEQNFSSNF